MQLTIQLLHFLKMVAIGGGRLCRLEERRICIRWMGDGPAAKLKLIHLCVLFVVPLTPWPL
ncbi:hypothetical protein D3C78_1905070 [compost metagenome]